MKRRLSKKTSNQSSEKPVASKSKRLRNNWTTIALKTLNGLLPLVLLLMIRIDLVELSIVLALFSKWRVFSVRPRHWLTNLRSNATDIIVKLGTLSFMIEADSLYIQLGWTAWYVTWLMIIKPMSSYVGVSLQALVGTLIGLSALFQYSNRLSEIFLLILVWVLAVVTSRHFLSQYQEPWAQVMSYVWALFVVQLSWVLYRWTLVYGFIPQLALIVVVVAYATASVYHAHKTETLKKGFIRQQFIMTSIALLAIAFLADWQGAI